MGLPPTQVASREAGQKLINSFSKTDHFIKMINSFSKTDDFIKIINSLSKTDDFTKTHKFSE